MKTRWSEKMKTNLSIFLIFVINFSLFGQEKIIYKNSMYQLSIINGRIRGFYKASPDVQSKKIDYPVTEKNIHGITYYSWGNNRHLVLKNPDIIYSFGKDQCLKNTLFKKDLRDSEFITPYLDNCNCSSFLVENEIEYKFDQGLRKTVLRKPWIEGKNGYGIGEWISFSADDINNIYISIGFVDYNKPNLFTENSRPKKIRIYYDEEIVSDMKLNDTADFQKYEIPDEIYYAKKSGTLRIEILEVYKGTKYQDTCINLIVADRSPRRKKQDNRGNF